MVHWAEGTNYSSNKYFFIKSCEILCKNPFILFYKITEMKIKSLECPKSIKNMKNKYLESQTLGWQLISPIGPAYHIVDCPISIFEQVLTYPRSNKHYFRYFCPLLIYVVYGRLHFIVGGEGFDIRLSHCFCFAGRSWLQRWLTAVMVVNLWSDSFQRYAHHREIWTRLD